MAGLHVLQPRERGGRHGSGEMGQEGVRRSCAALRNSGKEEALAMRGERIAVVEERHWSRATVSQEGAQIMVTICPQITSNEVGGKVQSARVCVAPAEWVAGSASGSKGLQ